ncbi:MAG: hypothetical protein K9G60_02695 [Pseudolabrys sp.]|nr:hypothetical protein [Pseudolabrys sp.]
MSPDLYFALTLMLKMTVTAGFVLAATVTAERAGPLVGGLVATLPLGAGPVYVFLALDHGAHFIGESAINSLAINTVNVIFALTYVLLAQKRSLGVSLSLAMLVWCVLAWGVHEIQWTFMSAGLLNVVVLGTCIAVARPLRHVAIPRMRTYWYDLALRASMVALLVGVTVSLSFRIGPAGSGILAVFPIILISVMLILHRRVGGKPTAAVMANAVTGLVGFAFACVVLHFTADAFGAAIGLLLAMSTSVAWGLIVFNARRRGFDI